MKSIHSVEASNKPHQQMQRPTTHHSNSGSELLYKKLQESLARTGNFNHPETKEVEKSFMTTLNIDQMRNYLDIKSAMYSSQAITNDNWPYPIYIRAFAPFKTFGMGFSGDGENRGYTTSLSATSRLSQSYIMDPSTHKYTNLVTKSDPSHHPLFGTKTASDDKGSISDFIYKVNKDGSNTISWTSTMAGHNPLIPGSPNINVKTKFSLTENTKTGTLDIMAQQSGDRFPAAETFIRDTKGNALLIGVSPYDGNPYKSLPGDDNDRPMMTANFSVNIDKNGVFTGIKMGTTIFSIQEWNKMMQSTPLNADDKDKSEKGGSFGGRGADRRW